MLDFDKIVPQVKNEYGFPVYLFDVESFKQNYCSFVDCMTSGYSNYRLAYSYKTNHAPGICKLVKELGGYAEVVSDMEYYIAKKLNYDNDKIIYNGPYKGKLATEHLLSGGILNVDSLDEVHRVIELAKNNYGRQLKVGIRVNSEIGQNFVSRFGIDSESDDLDNAVSQINKAKNIKLVGLHFHVGKARGIEQWKNRSERLLSLCDKYIPIPEYVDLGSGMFGEMEESLASQFGAHIPSYSDYASVTAQLFHEHYKHLSVDRQPILFTEPGTTVINKYISFAAVVDSIKKIKGKEFAVLNCSKYNLGEMCASKKLPLIVLHNGNNMVKCENLDMVGYTCLENDVLYKGYTGDLSIGDCIIFGNVGGYSNVAKPPFILPNCPMIAYNSDRTMSVIKRNEEYEDVFNTYTW